MSEIINQYQLLAPFNNKNAGFSRWTYALKDEKEFFIKEFLDPIYPTDDSLSLDLRNNRIKGCEEYEKKKKELYKTINIASHGNLVRISEFFRYDNHYYITTERIVDEQITIENMGDFSFDDRFLICKTIAFEIMNLHKKHIVHADIKDSNIIIKTTQNGNKVGKIIDLDAGFFENDPPKYEDDLGGDQVYLAPEACQFICGDSVELTCKLDVFALGLLFHQYLTGKMPGFDTSEYDYAFEAVLDEQELEIASELSPQMEIMIRGMLECDPIKRFSMDKVYSMLCEMDKDYEEEISNDAEISMSDNSISEAKKMNVENSSEKWFHSAGDL